ncbi:MAG: glycoside hydrolase family 2 protein [Terracidiphilus sp.]|nr:glycoside hydrolase family 2 protein [Terracidiphilus sp.]MDR3776182.1 glycoside hydrolase family 2 protein [Terracidiphilus sp.]
MSFRRLGRMRYTLSSFASLCLFAPLAAYALPASQSIHSGWQFRAVADTQHSGVTDWHAATVPGEVHTDLQTAGLIPDPFYGDNEKRLQWVGEQNWEYRTTLHPPPAILAMKHIELVFDGLDTFAEVSLNGHPLLKSDNMFRAWRADVRSLLHSGDNELRVVFLSPYKVMSPALAALPYILPGSGYEAYDPAKGIYPVGHYIRTAGYEYGWDWGPKLVTMGIWRPVRLEAWDDARITNLRIEQSSVTAERALLQAEVDVEAAHAGKVTVDLKFGSTAARTGEGVSVHGTATLEAGINHLKYALRIEHPRRWFPAGYGPQDRYRVAVEVKNEDGAKVLDAAHQTIGLRSVELRRQPDQWGTSFAFVVNGIAVFAKGANVIPMDSFPARVTPQRERALLTAARDANMNMIRMWGGGYYQTDSFYEIADELGLMIWQEFAFGGGMVPGDKAFQDNVRQEAVEQVRRLRSHPSVVLWCGNNEVETAWDSWGDRLDFKKQIGPDQRERVWQDYIVMFRDILKGVVVQEGGGVPYWPSSPGADFEERAGNSHNGDMHYWNVWSGAAPIADYRKVETRFLSEYGFQGMPDLDTVRAFAGSEESLTAPALANHERFIHGFDRIQHYLDEETGPARDFASFDYLSQFVQAEAIQTEAEHLRSQMPRAMGSLYWQLNDCWPVVSWASIDYYGRPKALQYYAKRFYAPVAIAPVYQGNQIQAHIVSDRLEPLSGTLRLRVLDFTGRLLTESSQPITVPALTSLAVAPLSTSTLTGFDATRDVAVFELTADGKTLASHTLYFAKTRDLQLPQPVLDAVVESSADGEDYRIRLQSGTLARAVQITTPGIDSTLSANFIDLLPNQPVEVHLQTRATLSQIRAALKLTSIASATRKP